MKIELNDVALCAVGSIERALAARALEISNGHCKFADSIFFSDEPLDGSFRNAKIEPLKSIAAYTAFMLKELHRLIETPFVLVTQWDGYVTHPTSWSSEFLNYDYIGAIWPWYKDEKKVGNGGFSLRSKRLLETMSHPQFKLLPGLNEDHLICRAYRPVLEQKYGIRFAPRAMAERFSYERGAPREPTFGFHGMFNFWREVCDTDLIQMIPLMSPSRLQNAHCAELIVAYFCSQRWRPLRALYRAWRSHISFAEVCKQIVPLMPAGLVPHCLQVCESLLDPA